MDGMPYLDHPQMTPLPWRILRPHARQAELNHGQTLERLAARGGLSVSEMLAVLEDRPWEAIDDVDAIDRITAIVRLHASERNRLK